MTWEQAEIRACLWMRENGFPDAAVTGRGSDGGVDVRSSDAVAQVKHHVRPVPRERIQQLSGIARAEARIPLFFSLSGYSQPALRWADEHGVALFVYLPVSPIGAVATEMVRQRPSHVVTALAPGPMCTPDTVVERPGGRAAPRGLLPAGARVRVQTLGSRGQAGTIEKVRKWPQSETGTWYYDVRLDKGGPLLRLVAVHKVEPL